jgi:hypothetical protein
MKIRLLGWCSWIVVGSRIESLRISRKQRALKDTRRPAKGLPIVSTRIDAFSFAPVVSCAESKVEWIGRKKNPTARIGEQG